jgi:aminoglycoside phosphotransferase
MTRVAAIVSAREQAEVLPLTITRLRDVGVGSIVVIDHGSSDRTLAYLTQEETLGDVWVHHLSGAPPVGLTQRLKVALARCLDAEWVIFMAADDLVVTPDALGSAHGLADLDAVAIGRFQVRAADPTGTRLRADPLPPRVMVRPELISDLLTGDHGIRTPAGRRARQDLIPDVCIARLPRVGDGEVTPATIARMDPHDLADRIHSASDVPDELGPLVATEDAYEDLLEQPGTWLAAAREVCRREGLGSASDLRLVTQGWFPVVDVPDRDVVIKFASSWKHGHERLDAERRALQLLADRAPALPVNRLLAHGGSDAEWRYMVVSRMDGVQVEAVRDQLGQDDVLRYAAWLGSFVATLHAVPVTAAERSAAWPGVIASVSSRHRHATRYLRAYDRFPHDLLAQVDDWLPPPEELLGSPDELTMTHCDLGDRHVFGRGARTAFEPHGVIDLGFGGIGHPLDDLGPIWWTALRCRRDLTTVFLANARLPGVGRADFPRRALAWALINPRAKFPRPELATIATLDELAERAFGQAPASIRIEPRGAVAVPLVGTHDIAVRPAAP